MISGCKNPVQDVDYQERGSRSWYHHIIMVLLVMQLFLEERLLQKKECPLLNYGDIAALLCRYLPRLDISEEEIFRQMQTRHPKRQTSTDWAYRKQDAKGLLLVSG